MKIAFVWWFDKAGEIFSDWRDGLRGAMEIVDTKHEVDWFLDKAIPKVGEYDFILFWSSSNEEYFPELHKYKARKGICLTTDPHNIENLKKLDVVFVESDPIYNACRMHGLRTIKAFGTDTDYFKPKKMEKDIEWFYPATFSKWKRQSEIAYLGDKLTCIGTVQPDGEEEYEACSKAGVNIEVGYFPVEKIREYYNRSKRVIIPAIHGSERTVLESMSMNVIPMVTNEKNIRTRSYINEYLKSGIASPREFVVKNYSHKVYAKNLLKGIDD